MLDVVLCCWCLYVCVLHNNGDEGKVIFESDFVAVSADFECLNFLFSRGRKLGVAESRLVERLVL